DGKHAALEAEILDALVTRGITRRRAASIVRANAPNRLGQVSDTIAYFDWLMKHGRKRVENPAGFLISLIGEELPVSFVSPPQENASAADAAAEIQRRSPAQLDD